jgi:hypothetical protein
MGNELLPLRQEERAGPVDQGRKERASFLQAARVTESAEGARGLTLEATPFSLAPRHYSRRVDSSITAYPVQWPHFGAG